MIRTYRHYLYIAIFNLLPMLTSGQNKYFVDGYHGGYWGHYPSGYTGFIADKLEQNPFWKINLEIEPVTWDKAKVNDEANYRRFSKLASDQSSDGRIEFVNPTFGQSYLFNIQGESVIRQFEMGIKKLKTHFPQARFRTYSSEEPCFTSALPGILKSFGFRYASLKNPNTCWGGYTRAFGGELVNWLGSDGSSLLTVPRYQSEKLLENSTWQTTAWNNSAEFIKSAKQQGILNPIGMCLQDAGWNNGPWLGKPKDFRYMLWADYIENIADKNSLTPWKFSQEDLLVSLVWGAQVLQKMSQNIRAAENKLIMAEKLLAINTTEHQKHYVGRQLDEAWENLLLAQHHDSWIVPYNEVDKKEKRNWAKQVEFWTGNSNRIADSITRLITVDEQFSPAAAKTIRVYNTSGQPRSEVVSYVFSELIENPVVTNAQGQVVPSQQSSENGKHCVLFSAEVPPLGFASYRVKAGSSKVVQRQTSHVSRFEGKIKASTDQFEVIFNPEKGGVIEQLVDKKNGNMQLVNLKSARSFNEMRGYFYKDSLYYSNKDYPAAITVVEDGPLRVKLKIEGRINVHPFTQIVTLTQGSGLIDFKSVVNWKGNPGIGQDYAQRGGWDAKDYKKAFYNDSMKLRAVFPLALKNQQVYKNAPFDVTESRLTNTYFNTWDSIKNNVILNWVDVSDGNNHQGIALLTDHTGSYTHDEDGILGLNLQYSGMGLWWRNYEIDGPSAYHYAIIPHQYDWDAAGLWNKSISWNEPLIVVNGADSNRKPFSMIGADDPALEVSSVTMGDGNLQFRVFNSSSKSKNAVIKIRIPFKGISLRKLNGELVKKMPWVRNRDGSWVVSFPIQQFGIRTIRLDTE